MDTAQRLSDYRPRTRAPKSCLHQLKKTRPVDGLRAPRKSSRLRNLRSGATHSGVMYTVKQETKAWGKVRHLFDTPQCAVSVLEVEKGGFSSRHYHEWRVNRFLVISGCIDVVHYYGESEPYTESKLRLYPGDVHEVDVGVIHRFEVIESGMVVEVYLPAQVSVADIKRLDVGGKKE